MKGIYHYIFVIIFAAQSAFAQNTKGGNVILSLGAGKDSYFHPLFNATPAPASTFEFPFSAEVMLNQSYSIGGRASIVILNDQSNAYMSANNSTKQNHNLGSLLFANGNLNYYAYNQDRLLWKIIAEGGYGKMDKIKYVDDVRSQIKGQGMVYSLGTSIRYHLGNEYDDIYPSFFELGIIGSRMNFNIKESWYDGEILEKSDPSWNTLQFNAVNIYLSVGVRIGKPAK
jgi:hypothetical protein